MADVSKAVEIRTRMGESLIANGATGEQLVDLCIGTGAFVNVGDIVVARDLIAYAFTLSDNEPVMLPRDAGHRYTEADLAPD